MSRETRWGPPSLPRPAIPLRSLATDSPLSFVSVYYSLPSTRATLPNTGMLFMSDEAMEIERMIQRWLKLHCGEGEGASQMTSWFADFFDKVGTLDTTVMRLPRPGHGGWPRRRPRRFQCRCGSMSPAGRSNFPADGMPINL